MNIQRLIIAIATLAAAGSALAVTPMPDFGRASSPSPTGL